MTTNRWRQIEEVFQSLLECAPESRAQLLEETCRDDSELRAEVESLLACYGKGEDYLAAGIGREAGNVAAAHAESMVGRRFGPYRVTELLGRGGMGNIYLALRDDDAFQKQVAIKVIKRGMDTDEILRRFRGERRILARLEHPNIARMLDGGATEDGLPYFVMEYVEVRAIDEYVHDHHLE